MRSMAKKNDRSDRSFASQPPKSTIFGPLSIYAHLVIIGRLLMIIRNCRKEGRKEGRSRKGTYIEPPEGPASSFKKEVGWGWKVDY